MFTIYCKHTINNYTISEAINSTIHTAQNSTHSSRFVFHIFIIVIMGHTLVGQINVNMVTPSHWSDGQTIIDSRPIIKLFIGEGSWKNTHVVSDAHALRILVNEPVHDITVVVINCLVKQSCPILVLQSELPCWNLIFSRPWKLPTSFCQAKLALPSNFLWLPLCGRIQFFAEHCFPINNNV